jgi:vacuolar-type H+-ATPase subunit D/Vma8
MATLTYAQRIAFATEVLDLLKREKDNLAAKGIDVSVTIRQLERQINLAVESETDQLEKKSASRDATKKAVSTLTTAYNEASNAVDLIVGAFGKQSELSKTIRNIRDLMIKEKARGKKRIA